MILALRALGVGDLATAVPAVRALRAAYPGETLVVAAPRWLAPLVDLIDGVDRLVPVAGLGDPAAFAGGAALATGGRPRGVRLAVNLHGRGPQSHHLLYRAKPDRLLAYACPQAGHLDGPDWRDDEYEVARWCRLLSWYGIAADPADLELRRPVGRHPDGLTIVHPGAKSPARRWPVERFAQVARELRATGHRVVVTGSAAERERAMAVADGAGLPDEAVLAGQTDTGALAGLVAGARLVISGDTGIAHLATAYRTPSVVLFGKMSPQLWGPPEDRPWHRALWRSELAGQPLGRGPHPALLATQVGDVLAAVTDVEQVSEQLKV